MNIYKSLICLIALSIGFASNARADERTDTVSVTIVEAINSAEGTVTIDQPLELDRIVKRAEGKRSEGTHANSNVGYRIQVFNDNSQRTARANAESRKRLIETAIPGLRGYLKFVSPYWRVRMGDFKSYSETEDCLNKLKAAFPQYAPDMRIVREPINATR